MGIKVHVVYAIHHESFNVDMLYFMDSTCQISSFSCRLLISEDFTKANHNLLFVLKLSKAWYDQSWLRIYISLPTAAHVDPIGRVALLIYALVVDDGGG